MQEGLLWFDDDPKRSTADKVARAVQRYQQKYGHRPDVCYVHPGTPDVGTDTAGVRVAALKTVLVHHFWLGVERM